MNGNPTTNKMLSPISSMEQLVESFHKHHSQPSIGHPGSRRTADYMLDDVFMPQLCRVVFALVDDGVFLIFVVFLFGSHVEIHIHLSASVEYMIFFICQTFQVSKCHTCQRRSHKKPNPLPLQHIQVEQLLQLVCINLIFK